MIRLSSLPTAVCLLMLWGCTSQPSPAATPEQRMQACPASPNCVSSDAVDRLHAIEPIQLNNSAEGTWQALLNYLETEPHFKVVAQQADYLRVESRTPLFRFVDDIEFELRPAQGIIAVRSASRLGFSDLGKNRSRLEKLRRALQSEPG